MENYNKTKEQLIKENILLKNKLNELEKSENVLQNSNEILQKRNDWLHFSLEINKSWVFNYNFETGKIVILPNNLQHYGYQQEEIPETIEELSKLIHPDDISRIKQEIAKNVKEEKSEFNTEFRFLNKNKEWVQIIGRGKLINFSNDNKLKVISGIAKEICEEKKAEAKHNQQIIKRSLEFHKLISSISSSFVGNNNLNDSINELLRKIGEHCGVSRSYVILINNDKKIAFNTHEWCAEGVSPQIQNLQNQTIADFPYFISEFKKNGYVHIKNVTNLPKEAHFEKTLLDSQNIKSLVVLPLNTFGNVIGFIGFDNIDEEKTWSDESLEILKISSEIIAGTIHSKKIEDDIKAAKDFAENLLETANSIVITLDTQANIISFNKYAEDLTGYKKEEVVGKNWFDIFIPTSHKKTLRLIFKKVMNSMHEGSSKENPIILKNGKNCIISWSNNIIRDTFGNIMGVLSIGNDITKQKEIEQNLISNEEKYRSLTESMKDVVVRISTKGKLLYVSPSIIPFSEYLPEEEIGNNITKYFANRTDLLRSLKLLKNIVIDRKSGIFEFEFKPKNKTPFTVELTYIPIIKAGEVDSIQLVLRDISMRKKAEQEVRKSRKQYKLQFEQFRLMADNSTDMMWAKNMDGIFTFTNKAICDKLLNAKDVNEAIGKHVMFFVNREKKAHPENKEWFTFGEDCINSDAITIAKAKTCRFNEYGNVFGKFLYLDVYKTPLWNNKGKMIGTVGSARIVTKEKEIEKSLKESQARFKALSKATYEAIFLSEKGICVETNRAAVNMFGYSYNELIGIFGTNVIAPESKELVKKNMMSGYEKPYDAIALRKDGTKFHAEFQGRMFKYKDRDVRITAVRDITVRKEYEIALQKNKEELQKFNTALLDLVEKEVKTSREKDRMMLNQAKQAAIGEMIGNIAHQWRQPLNDIGLYIQNLQDSFEFNELSAENLHSMVEKTMNKLEYMSQTIDDFRNFFHSDKEKTSFSLTNSINKTKSLTEASFRNNSIKIIMNLEENLYFSGYSNEFSQAILNILINAKDVLLEKKIKNPYVKISLWKKERKILLTISNNGGKINENIIDKIFDPYFTTKSELTGTGLGLYISKTIIERNMSGKLSVKNIKEGAEFRIEL